MGRIRVFSWLKIFKLSKKQHIDNSAEIGDLLNDIDERQKKIDELEIDIKKSSNYPKWKHLIPSELTSAIVDAAFIRIFQFPAASCRIEWDGVELLVVTPNETFCHGGFVQYTDTPNLAPSQRVTGAPSWGIDLDGIRFHFVDALKKDWDKIYAMEIISRYLNSLPQDGSIGKINSGHRKGMSQKAIGEPDCTP